MKSVARILLVAALMISIGLHWVVLQSAAWVGMAVAYTVDSGSVIQGISETFDGEHPCPLCQAVSEGVQSSSKNKESVPVKKGDDLKIGLALVQVPQFVFAHFPPIEWDVISDSAHYRPISPAAPPPKSGGMI